VDDALADKAKLAPSRPLSGWGFPFSSNWDYPRCRHSGTAGSTRHCTGALARGRCPGPSSFPLPTLVGVFAGRRRRAATFRRCLMVRRFPAQLRGRQRGAPSPIDRRLQATLAPFGERSGSLWLTWRSLPSPNTHLRTREIPLLMTRHAPHLSRRFPFPIRTIQEDDASSVV
jgi:hypothetical protein